MSRHRYNYIRKLVDKITTSSSNNIEFCCYGHLVTLESGLPGYVAVTLYSTIDRYSGELADFSFDYRTHELYVEYTDSEDLFDAIVRAFQGIYGRSGIRISREQETDFE